ncbi:MAG: hypothetical protein HOM14_10495 [Gammaproteobacteria bacterium]|jgi:hypothetical protein|nr:hypothetical protein [Gammaproteobacteria bacterium]MBT4078128.1 hypothetical protein [Gammaproteobacteria bacterium]MBT6551772.1 hypothetical protein [Gammaproteobacteria bacterium]
MEFATKIALLISFVMFIPISAACYFYSRNTQRNTEVKRYLEILKIQKTELFQHQHPKVSLSVAVLFVTFLSACFWGLILFGAESGITRSANYLLGGASIIGLDKVKDAITIHQYQSGALLTFTMAFMGAYLWGIQNITRRYSMNDLIPAAYYNIGTRMIYAGILALVFFHLSKSTPDILSAMLGSSPDPDKAETATSNGTNLLMPVIAFLIGMFPQRGLKWLTDKFSIFTQQQNPTVRDLPLEMVEGITMYDRVRLQELGIDSCYDLANMDYIPYLFKSPYSPRILINWILQAKLCIYFGKHVKELREHGIHTAWQLKNYDEEALKELVKTTSLTEDTLIMVKDQVTEDKEIERLIEAQLKLSQYWNKQSDEVDIFVK